MTTDTERLDFLIERGAHAWATPFGEWHVTVGPSDDSENLEPWNGHYESAREAIDAAMKAKAGAPQDVG